jgi:Mrp family chromosome partitioning ATPase
MVNKAFVRYLGKNQSISTRTDEHASQLLAEKTVSAGNTALALQPFHATLRDRLIQYLDNNNLVHKPKMIAVTGISQRAGVTTTATGLAQSLSETGDGNVLLVDMTAEQGSAQHYFKGKAVSSLEETLKTKDSALVQDKLYVVTEGSNSDRLSRNMPQRFAKLLPKLRASDFDYIIFDMPSVSQISVTPRLANFMDMILLVIEAEKTDQEIALHATSMLTTSKTPVSVVLNKTKSYIPAALHQDRSALLGT